jgi:glutaredoxin-dependent peroxiredoxin
VQVVPVLPQPAAAVKRYIEETGLPFNVLADGSRDVVKAYGVWHRLGLDAWNTARPAVFLIDSSGTIRYAFVARRQNQFPSHDEIVAAIDGIRGRATSSGFEL